MARWDFMSPSVTGLLAPSLVLPLDFSPMSAYKFSANLKTWLCVLNAHLKYYKFSWPDPGRLLCNECCSHLPGVIKLETLHNKHLACDNNVSFKPLKEKVIINGVEKT